MAMPARAQASSCGWLEPELPTPPMTSVRSESARRRRARGSRRCRAAPRTAARLVRFWKSSVLDAEHPRRVGLAPRHFELLRGRLLVAHQHEHLAGAIDDGDRGVESLRLALGQRPLGDGFRQAERQVALGHDALRRRPAGQRERDPDSREDSQRAWHVHRHSFRYRPQEGPEKDTVQSAEAAGLSGHRKSSSSSSCSSPFSPGISPGGGGARTSGRRRWRRGKDDG